MAIVRGFYFLITLALCCWVLSASAAEEFKLNNGETLTGEVLSTSANDQGVLVKVGEGDFKRVQWGNFSQEDLKKMAKDARLEPFVQPFIEITPEEKRKRTEVNIKAPPRLERPARQSLFGALFSSSLGIFVMLLLYAGIIYAGYEVAIFRAQPPLLVGGLSAIPVLGFFVPIIFLCLPTRMTAAQEVVEAPAAEGAPAPAIAEQEVNPMLAEGAQHPTTLRLAHSETEKSAAAVPETVVYQRGQYTFNRRFFETKFPGFFGVVRRDADKDMVLVIKSARGEYSGQRISRIAANDLHLQVQRGHATEEVLIPFTDIQEIRLKRKEANR